jgi:hypothetical protein
MGGMTDEELRAVIDSYANGVLNLSTAARNLGMSTAAMAHTMRKFNVTASASNQFAGKSDTSIAGISADFVIHDEWDDIEYTAAELQAIADNHTGVLRREALRQIERREQEQNQLEALPGYGSF